jgi:hypothetical protein
MIISSRERRRASFPRCRRALIFGQLQLRVKFPRLDSMIENLRRARRERFDSQYAPLSEVPQSQGDLRCYLLPTRADAATDFSVPRNRELESALFVSCGHAHLRASSDGRVNDKTGALDSGRADSHASASFSVTKVRRPAFTARSRPLEISA